MALFDDYRPAWGGSKTPSLSSYNLVALPNRVGRTWHWAGPACYLFGKSHQSCLNLVAAWERYHRSKGWGAIGYNALVCVHARAIEGRGIRWQGAHSPGHNRSHFGIQYMVGGNEKVTDAMFARGTQLAQDLEKKATHDLRDEGHSDNTATSCPGSQILSWVRAGGPEKGGGSTYKPFDPKKDKLKVDGNWGPNTTSKAQVVYGSGYVDGEVSRQRKDMLADNPGLLISSWEGLSGTVSGSPLVVEIQEGLGVEADGVWGRDTAKRFQKKAGTTVDGEIWKNSPAVKVFQQRLNEGKKM